MRALILVLLATIAACASVAQTSDLHQDYVSIVGAINNKKYDFVEQRISASKKAAHSDINATEFSQKYPFIYSLGTLITKEVSNFSIKKPSKSCLTVNGFDSSGEPVTVNIEFSLESGLNQISYVALHYLESDSEFTKVAVCPNA